MTVKTDITIDEPKWTRARLGIKTLAPEILTCAWKTLPQRPQLKPSVSLVFTSDREIQKINRQFRKKNKPTNVLSFPQFENMDDMPRAPREGILLGDIVIAFETVKSESEEAGISLKDHTIHMMIHGFLHLLGYDHMNDMDAEIMESLEIKILKKCGIANPYHFL
jgi:probable rRNA maturation factor